MKILVTDTHLLPYNSGLGNAVQQQVVSLKKHGCEVVVATGGSTRGRREDPLSGATVGGVRCPRL